MGGINYNSDPHEGLNLQHIHSSLQAQYQRRWSGIYKL